MTDTQPAIPAVTYAQVLPFSAEAEAAVIGSLLIDGNLLQQVEFLQPADFHIERNRWVYQAMQQLRNEGQDIDYLTVAQRLEQAGRLREAGGPARLMELVNSTATTMHVESYARIVQEEAGRRRLVAISSRLAAAAFDKTRPTDAAISAAMDALSRVTVGTKGAVHISQFLSEIYDEVEAAMQNPRDLTGIDTGFPDWNNVTGGLQRGTVLRLAGDPAAGKTLLAVQVLMNAWEKGHAPGALYELEMKGTQVVRRNVSRISRIPTAALRSGKVPPDQIDQFTKAIERMEAMQVYISDEPRLTTAELRVDLQRLVDAFDVQVAVIDYEALLGDEGENENERRNRISDAVHAIAKDLNLALISIADMTKAGIQRQVSGQGAAAGTGHELHNADEIAFLQATEFPNVVNLRWEKLREPNGTANYVKLTRLAGLPAFENHTPEANAQKPANKPRF